MLSSFHTIWLREEPENNATQISTWYFYSSSSEFSAQLSQAPLVNVRCSLRDAGFHSILVTEVHAVTHEALSLCHDTPVLLVENITQDMYLDLDQVCRTVASLPVSHAHTYESCMGMRLVRETDPELIPYKNSLLFPYVCHFLVDFSTNRVWRTSGTELDTTICWYLFPGLDVCDRSLSYSYSPIVSCYPLQVIASAHMDTEKAAAVSSDAVALVYSQLHDNWYACKLKH